MRSTAVWRWYLLGGGLAGLLYVFFPPLAGSAPVMNLLGLSGVVAVVAGLRLNRPASPGPWRWFAFGLALFWLGDLYTYAYPKLLGADVPFPSLGDAVYIAVYPALMAGLIRLVRRRNPDRDRGGVIDSTIMTLGLSLLSWVGLIAPYLHASDMPVLARAVSIAYPLGDILLLAAAIRLAVDAGRRQPAFYLLASSIVALLVTDFAYGLVTLAGTYHGQLSLDAGWIAFYVLWGAAALHPSMRGLEQPIPDHQPRLSPLRLLLLTLASLIAPGVEIVLESRRANVDLMVIIGASAVLFALVVVRMAGLVRQQERSAARERVLSAAGAALVAATRREEMLRAALDAAAELLGGKGAVAICRVQDGRLSVVAGDERAAAGSALRLPLTVKGEARGLLAVAASQPTPLPVQGALRSLAAQLSLALESAALTEEVHRRSSEARMSSLVQHASDLITVIGAGGTVMYQSPSIQRVLGHSPEEVAGQSFERLLAPSDRTRMVQLLSDGQTGAIECSLRHRDGSVRQFEILQTNLLDDEHVRGIVLNGRDVSERKAFEEQLAHQAFHDPVTGLANRALFAERVRHAVARARREHAGLAVLFLDLDDFKTINDSLGHAAGDEVLVEVAKRLGTSVRASDTAARFGGDEFAILLEEVSGAQEAADTAERILAALAVPLRLAEKELVIRSSLGISVVEGDAPADADELIRNADAAMYIAKRDGKGGYRLFEPAMHEGVLARLELRADLQRALASDQLELHYQPVVRLLDGAVTGVEALVRWRHPERGLVSPGDFIPFAEETGLILPIGRWVLREGCHQARIMADLLGGDPGLTMSINLSVHQLQHSDIVGDVRDALQETGLNPQQLTLEITETVMVTDTELAVQRLEELKALGVRLAMDDFGTGYSSLSYLSRLPVDILKMDRSFLRADAGPETAGLAKAVISLGETLKLEVVAEGIELPGQRDRLRDLGCDLGQGFYFAKPMEADAAVAFLRATRGAAALPDAP